jgi:flagellar protein FliS
MMFDSDESRDRELEQRYLADYVMTATPERRLLMLFDHLKIDLHNAEDAFGLGDNKKINDSLVHAQQILCALRDPLDLTVEVARQLRPIYTFCIDRLVMANIKKDVTLLPAVIDTIEQIASANERAFAMLSGASHADV